MATDVTSIVGCAVLTGAGVILNTLDVRVSESVGCRGGRGRAVRHCRGQHRGRVPHHRGGPGDDKLAFAQRFGATHGVNASQGDPVKAIQALTGGGVDYAIDCIGAARTQEQILYAARPGGIGLKKGGTACLVGAVQELGALTSRSSASLSAPTRGHAGVCAARIVISPSLCAGFSGASWTWMPW